MKQVDADTYNIAWFKLADCVARGEKERALGVYRLLSHSFDDRALACQLKADILRAFGDHQAIAAYKQAADLYRDRGNWLEAAAIYEHLAVLEPSQILHRFVMIELYQHLSLDHKVTQYVMELVTLLCENNEWQKATEAVLTYEHVKDDLFTAQLHELLIDKLLTIPQVLPHILLTHVIKAIDARWALLDEQAIQRLFIIIKNVKQVTEHAHAHWQSIRIK